MQRKIMIVDDNDINRELLHAMLSSEYEVVDASDGREALKLLAKDPKSFSAVLLDIVMPKMDGYSVLKFMREDEAMAQLPVIVTTGNTEVGAEARALKLGANDYVMKPYNPETIKHRVRNTINLRETAAIVNATRRDALTGLYSRSAFFELVGELVSKKEAGYYVMSCFDIERFKVINDQYGNEKGDEVLKLVAQTFREGFNALGGICCRIMADNFAVLYPVSYMDSKEVEKITKKATELDGSILPITVCIGRYVVEDTTLSSSAMYDRAVMAKSAVKGRFDKHTAVYDESMRNALLREQEVISEMKMALRQDQFEVWLQPQYNHVTGALMGAEALVRWRHPVKGLISPGVFIPIFEKNGFVYEVDKYVWEQTCRMQRQWLDEGKNPVPISVNISRYDIRRHDLVDVVSGLVKKYEIPTDLLRLEITESAFAQSSNQIIEVVKKFQKLGFIMEIDDFGSGYSSLNTLKDVPADVLKLDMRFLEGEENRDRGGNILEAIVRMAKWLGMSLIAEGVETKEQADFLKSIGCNCIQGYYYARPMVKTEYEELSRVCDKEDTKIEFEKVKTFIGESFWNPSSVETLIFNEGVGAACIIEYYQEKAEVLRANDGYARLMSSDNPELAIDIKWSEHMEEAEFRRVTETIEKSIASTRETIDNMRLTGIGGTDAVLCLKAAVYLMARAGDRYLLYCMIDKCDVE